MIFDNVFFSATFYVMLFSFVTGFVGFLLIGTILKKRSPQLVQYKSGSKFYLSALICGLTSSFFLSIVICTLTPTLITVEDDLSYTEELSFTSNGQFIGIGGSYIANNSNKSYKFPFGAYSIIIFMFSLSSLKLYNLIIFS